MTNLRSGCRSKTPAQIIHQTARCERNPADSICMGGADVAFDPDELGRSPIVAVGTLDEVCDQLIETRRRYGISYFAAPVDARPEVLAPVIERLAGT